MNTSLSGNLLVMHFKDKQICIYIVCPSWT